ncbi:MAG: DUF6418 domain-containing protein [Candidatus Zixiibacteriota bacterium]
MLIANTIGVLIYIVLCGYLVRQDKKTFVFFAFLAFSQVWSLISCWYNDFGIYNIELFRYTETTLATFRLSMLYCVFNLGFLAMIFLLKDKPLARVDYAWSKETLKLGPVKVAIYGTIGLVILYIVYSFYTGGIPIYSGFDKLAHFEEAGRIERTLILYGFLFAFLLGYFRKMRGKYSVNGILLAVFMIYLLLAGNKFSSLMLLLVCYYAPIFARYYFKNPDVKVLKAKYIGIVLIVVIVLVGIAFMSYAYGSDNVSFAGNYLLNRIFAFQGEMWWAIDYDYHLSGMYDDGHWNTELNAVFSPREYSSTDVGMKYLMIEVLGPEKAYPIIEKGYLYTMTYPGILIAMFPLWAAFVIQFFAGVIFFLLLYYFYYAVVYGHFFRALVTVMMIIPYITVLFTGNLGVFFTFGMAIKIIILILLELGGAKQLRSGAHV